MVNIVQHSEQATDSAISGLVPAVNSACRILLALVHAESPGLTLTELARNVGLSKSTVHGLLATLRANGFVRRDEGSRSYQLGGALIMLGGAAVKQIRAATLLGQQLPRLAHEYGLTFAIAQVTGEGDAQVIDSAYPASDVHVGLAPGSRYGYFDGAIGKSLLAALEPTEAEQIVRTSPIPRHTDRTITEPEALLDEIDAVRTRGWAASECELKENHAVATTLRDASGQAELALFAVGFPGQLGSERIQTIGAVLCEAVAATLDAIGLKSPPPYGAAWDRSRAR
jgi:IclR family acetate operon transcriptional repressor